jgi:hypothetical protein
MSADAHRGDNQRFIVRADEKLTAFIELESGICACGFLALNVRDWTEYNKIRISESTLLLRGV